MFRNDPGQSLAEKLGITEADIRERKMLLSFHAEHEAALARMRPTVELIIDDVIGTFYQRQLEVPAIRAMIGDRDTLNHLKGAMHTYVLELFGGTYGLDYAQRRLRVGRIHGRIGIPSKYYVAALYQLFAVLGEKLEPITHSTHPPVCLRRLMLLDLELTFDTYIHGLLSELEAKNEELAKHSSELEAIIAERTSHITELSRIDTLTGLDNRNTFDQSLVRECDRTQGARGTLTLVFLDLDGFKQVNDTHGHDRGDAVLKAVGQAIQSECRATDTPFRYGGDEFCILLRNVDAAGAALFAERLERRIAEHTPNGVSASIGWAVSGPSGFLTPEMILAQADAAMYRTKGTRKAQRALPDPGPSITSKSIDQETAGV